MKYRLSTIILCTLLLGCAPYRDLNISGEEQYVTLMRAFVNDGIKYGGYEVDLGGASERTNIKMIEMSMGSGRVAACGRKSGMTVTTDNMAGVIFYDSIDIMVNKDTWNSMNADLREAAFYHEMGHCFLNLGHDDRKIVLGGKNLNLTIMNAMAFASGSDYRNNRDYYLTKLFRYWE